MGRARPGRGTAPGVLGQTNSTSANAIGTEGLVDSTSPGSGSAAVRGINNGTGVYGVGVWGSHAGSGWGGYFTTGANGIGVNASAGDGGVGVNASSGSGGTGVYGHNSGSTGIGVHGQTSGTGSAVFGEATAGGVGVFGKSQSGTALRGDSPSGTALQVNGKAKFSRSGIVTIASGTASKTVSLSGVSANSMVFAMAQQNPGVYVKAAIPASGSFTIYLTGNAPGSGLKVAYFVLN